MKKIDENKFFEQLVKSGIPCEETLYMAAWIKGYLSIDNISEEYQLFREQCIDTAFTRFRRESDYQDKFNEIDIDECTKADGGSDAN